MLHNIRINERLVTDEDFQSVELDDEQINSDPISSDANNIRRNYIVNFFS